MWVEGFSCGTNRQVGAGDCWHALQYWPRLVVARPWWLPPVFTVLSAVLTGALSFSS